MSRAEQIDIAELQLCQAHLDSSSQRIWQSGAILLAGTVAALGFALQIDASEFAAAEITTIFAIGAILVLALWHGLVGREQRLARASKNRMRALEESFQMQRQALIKAADDATKASPWIAWLGVGGTTESLQKIGLIVQFGWIAVAGWRWLIYSGAF